MVGCAGLAPSQGYAGAFMMPEGQGQMIAGVGYIEASRTFDRSGHSQAAPTFMKAEAGAYVEYGATDWLTLIVAPTFARMKGGVPATVYTGSDQSAFGVRLPLYRDGVHIVSLQALMEPPIGPVGGVAAARFGSPNSWAGDLRLQFGQSFALFGWPGFVDLQAGMRLRAGPWPHETHADVAVGFRPLQRILILVQAFTATAPRAGPNIASIMSSKLELSLVYDLTPAWSVQAGYLMAVAGRNAARENGPLAALWHRF